LRLNPAPLSRTWLLTVVVPQLTVAGLVGEMSVLWQIVPRL
jgi:hypothetical protein